MPQILMFTGIVETVGQVLELRREGNVLGLTIKASFAGELSLGESVAVEGVCTTVTKKDDASFTVQLQGETIKRTSLGSLKYGQAVNLERAVTPTTRLGGHFVEGHVDCCVPLRSFHREGTDLVLRFSLPPELTKYAVEKGYIAVNGISLTIAYAAPDIQLHIIPATFENTTLKNLKVGDSLNIETDILGKYVVNALRK
ncbi:riboflavin synthase [bacterium]|nr:riboflavin synthase [bacterium]